MTVNRTTLLDLPLPVTGTESGTWGDTTNNGLTQYVDIAIAGMSNLTSANFTAGALTIETTEGDSSATNISATSAQYAGFRVTSLAANSTITVGNTGTSPARSYRLINADATYSLTFKATGQTGVTLLPGQSALVAFNGTDYVIVGTVGAGSTTDNTVPRFDGTTGKILQSSGITIDDSNNVSGVAQLNITTLDATNIEVTNIKAKDGTAAASIADSTGVISVTANPVLSGGTANGVLYLNGSKVATSGSALTFDGTNFNAPAAIVSGSIGMLYGNTFSAGNSQTWLTNNATASDTYRTADTAQRIRMLTGIGFTWETAATGTIGGAISWSEQMRLTSTGLGIGTSSPGQKLEVYGTLRVRSATEILDISAPAGKIDFNNLAGDPLSFSIGSSEKMRLDSSGNLGLGVTPSAWQSGRKALQVGYSSMNSYSNSQIQLGANFYYDGTNNKYLTSDYSTVYQQLSGQHQWYIAPSGTAGNAITFTQAMTLDASGVLMVGSTTAGSDRVRIKASNTTGSSIYNYLNCTNEIDSDLQIRITGSAATDKRALITTTTNTPIAFGTNDTERARITSGGDLLVGSTTGASARLYVQGSGTTSGASAFRVQDSATADIFIARNDGQIFTGTKAASPYNNTTAAAANMVVDSSGVLLRSTSALKYKQDIRDLESTNIDALRPVRYKSKCNNDDQTKDHLGLIADEAAAVGFEELVTRNSDGEIEGFQYERLTVVLLKEIQSLRTRLAAAGI